MHGDPNRSEDFGGRCGCPPGATWSFDIFPNCPSLLRVFFLAVAQLLFVEPSDFVAFGGKNEGPVTPAPAALAGQLEPGQLGAELALSKMELSYNGCTNQVIYL